MITADLIIFECIQNVGELEETLKRLQNHKGVTGVIVIDGKVMLPKCMPTSRIANLFLDPGHGDQEQPGQHDNVKDGGLGEGAYRFEIYTQ